MKTYAEIYNEVLYSDFVGDTTTVNEIEEFAAKQYAKQWVELVLKEEAGEDSELVILAYHKAIDSQ